MKVIQKKAPPKPKLGRGTSRVRLASLVRQVVGLSQQYTRPCDQYQSL